MADAPAATSKKKVGGLGAGTWALIAGAAVAGYIGIRYLRGKSGTSGTTTSTALSGGNTVPQAIEVLPQTATGTISSLPEWISAFLKNAVSSGYTSSSALNDVDSWLSGGCVSSAGYRAIGAAIASSGLPPGSNVSNQIQVCKNTSPGASGTGSTPGTANKGTSSASATTYAAGLSTAVLGGIEYYVLGGFNQAGEYVGSNVGGGAPVLFTWAGNGTPTVGKPPATAKTVTVFTPTATPARQIGPGQAGEHLFTTEHVTGTVTQKPS